METYDKIKDALEKAKELEYTNGMATKSIDIKTEYGNLSIIRKSGDLEKPEYYLIRAKPNMDMGHNSVNRNGITDVLEDYYNIRGLDVNFVFKNHEYYDNPYTYSLIIPVSLFDN